MVSTLGLMTLIIALPWIIPQSFSQRTSEWLAKEVVVRPITESIAANQHPQFEIVPRFGFLGSNLRVASVTLTNPHNETVDAEFQVQVGDGDTRHLEIVNSFSNFQPGKYSVVITGLNHGVPISLETEFWWGVIGVNVRAATQEPGRMQTIHIAVLDDYGRTLCQAPVRVWLTDPAGFRQLFSTEAGTVERNPDCRDRSVTNEPDYYVNYRSELAGEFIVEVEAETPKGVRLVSDRFILDQIEVAKVDRTRFPTRIYPPAQYPVGLELTPRHTFTGPVEERVPASFVLSDISHNGVVALIGDEQRITWTGTWEAGQIYELGYTFKAPNVSPYLYRIGPARVTTETGRVIEEERQWQIAADATKTWDGGGSTASWSECANWNGDTCPANTGDDIVFDGTSNDNSDWDAGSSVTSIASLSVTSMSGSLTFTKTPVTVAGNFSHTSTGNVVFAGSVGITVTGDFTLTTSGSLTQNTSTVTMNGTGGKTVNTTKTFYNLTINPSSAATVNISTNDPKVSNTVTIAAGDTLAIASGQTLTHTGTTISLSGTLSGPGRFVYQSTTNFPTTGTLSGTLILRFDATNNDMNVSARTDYGALELYSNATVARAITLGTAISQTISASSYLYVMADSNTGGADLTIYGDVRDPVLNVGGDLDFTGVGSTSEIVWAPNQARNWTVGGNVDFSGGTYAGATETLVMTGNANLIGNGQTIGNLTIDGSTNTVNIITSDVSVAALLTVASSDELTIASGRLVTLTALTGTALTLNGTISGAGKISYATSTNFPTSGTFSAGLRLVSTSGNRSLPARTYGGLVELYSASSTLRTVTLGTGASQTITISSHLYLAADSTANIVATGLTNAPTVTIGGDLDLTGVGSGSERIITGAGVWTIGGNFDLSDGSLFTATSGNQVILTGINVNVLTANRAFYDLTFNPASASTFVFDGGSGVSNLLTIGSNANVAFIDSSDYLDLSNNATTSFDLDGEISGDGLIYYYSIEPFPATGTVNAPIYLYSIVDMIVPGRTFGSDLWIEGDNTSVQTITFGTAGGQTITIGGYLHLGALSTANQVIDAATYDPNVSVGQELDFIGTGAGTEIINAGTGTWTVSGDVDFTNGQYNVESGNTLVMNGTSKTLTSASQTLNNLTLSGTIILANATHTVSGNLNMAGATITAGSSTVTMTGTSNTITGGGVTLNNLTIDPSSAGTITLQTSDVTVSGTLTIAGGDTLSIDSARTVSVAAITLNVSSVVSGAGRLTYTGSADFTQTSGTISAIMRFDATANNQTIIGRAFGGDLELYSSSSTNDRTITIGTNLGQAFSITGSVYLLANGANNLTLSNGSFNPSFSVTGDFDLTGTGGGTEIIDELTASVAGNVDLTGGSVVDSTMSLLMVGTGGKTMKCAGTLFSGLTINPSSADTITAQASDCSTGTLTVSADDTLSIDTGVNVQVNTSMTLTGSITGAGRLVWASTNLIPDTGTLSSIVRYDTTDIFQTVQARTSGYGSDLEFYTDGNTFTSMLVTLGAGTLSVAGDLVFYVEGNQSYTLDSSANNPTVNITGSIHDAGTMLAPPGLSTGTGTWTVSGSVDFTNITFTPTSGNLFIMDGASKTLTSAGRNFQNFEIAGGSTTTTDQSDIDGTFTMSAGSFTADVDEIMYVAGDFTLANGTTFVGPTGTGWLVFNGDLTGTDNNVARQNLGNVQIGTSPDTFNMGSDMLYLNLTVKSGDVFNTNGYDPDIANNLTVDGTFDATDDVETDESMIEVGGNFTLNSGATFVQDQSTVRMDGNSGTKDLITNGSFSLYNLTLNDGAGSLVVEVEDALDVDNNLTITGGTLDAKTGEDNAIEVGGNWDNDDTFLAQGGTVTMNGASGTKTIDAVGTGNYSFYNLTFNDGGGSTTYQLSTLLDVDNNLTITGGNFNANSNTVYVGGGWDNDDTFTSGTQTTYFNALSGTKTIDADGTGTEAFSTVVFDDSTGGVTWQLTTSMDVNGDFTLSLGTFDFNGSNTLNVAGNFVNGGLVTESTGTLVMDAASGTKYIDVSGADSTGGAELNNVTFNDGGGTATYKLGYPLDVNGNVTVTGGTFDVTGPTTWYLTPDMRSAPDYSSNLKPIDPASAADESTVCTDGGGSGNYCIFIPNEWALLSLSGLPSTIQNSGWMLGDGQGLTGQVATGTWTVKATLDYYIGRCTYATKQFVARLWKADPDLANPTAITNWATPTTLLSGLNDYTFNFSSVAAQTFTNQVIYVEFAVRLSTGSCAPSGDDSLITLKTNEGGSKQQINTPALTMTLNAGGNWDNNDTFTHGSNKVIFDAGATGKTIEAGASSFYDVDFDNGSGGWTVQTNDMTVANDLSLIAGSAWTLESGRTLEVNGAFSHAIAAANTTWTGSTLYLNGSGGMYDINAKTHGGDTYATLRVGASEDISMWDSDASAFTIDSGACLFSQDHATTAGRLNVYGTCNSRANEYWSYATDFDGAALGGSSRQADVRFASGAALTVDSGDALEILGQNISANRTLITRQSSGNYGLTIDGTISAQFYDFDYLDASGLNISSTATVTELANGSFDNAGSGASSSYIIVTGITSTDEFANNVFDDNADGADAAVVYNVNGDGAGIDWTFSDATGNKAGEDFDREVNGAVISWGVLPNLTLTLNDNLMNLGVLNPSLTGSDTHTISVTTNASNGYTCRVVEDGNLRDGSNVISDVTDNTVSTGSEEYGISCSGGGCALGADDEGISGTPLTVASNIGPVTDEVTTMTYEASVDQATDSGNYSHIVTFTCSANF